MKVDGYLGSVEFDGAMVTVQKKMRGKVKIPLSSIQGVSIVSAGVGMRGIRFMTAGGSLQQVGKAIGSHAALANDPQALTFKKKHLPAFEALSDAVLTALAEK